MALRRLPRELLFAARDFGLRISGTTIADAVGESTAYVGYIFLQGGDGSSKVLSAAGGGKIHFAVAPTLTWANAGTTLRVGVQDVDGTSGLEDGTHDVYADLVPGTDTLTVDVPKAATMTSGTKTITHGDKIAVVIELVARAGADSVRPYVNSGPLAQNLPYCTVDQGAGPAKNAVLPLCIIEFDDGTIGHFGPGTALATATNTTSFNSGSTPDEYAMLFSLPFRAQVSGLAGLLGEIDTTEDGELILYSDPLGTPVAERTVTIDPDVVAQTGNAAGETVVPCTGFIIQPNVTYAVAYRPTSTGNRVVGNLVLATANGRKAHPLGDTIQGGSRTNQTGAFGTLSTTTIPALGVLVSHLDDGLSVRARHQIGI